MTFASHNRVDVQLWTTMRNARATPLNIRLGHQKQYLQKIDSRAKTLILCIIWSRPIKNANLLPINVTAPKTLILCCLQLLTHQNTANLLATTLTELRSLWKSSGSGFLFRMQERRLRYNVPIFWSRVWCIGCSSSGGLQSRPAFSIIMTVIIFLYSTSQ